MPQGAAARIGDTSSVMSRRRCVDPKARDLRGIPELGDWVRRAPGGRPGHTSNDLMRARLFNEYAPSPPETFPAVPSRVATAASVLARNPGPVRDHSRFRIARKDSDSAPSPPWCRGFESRPRYSSRFARCGVVGPFSGARRLLLRLSSSGTDPCPLRHKAGRAPVRLRTISGIATSRRHDVAAGGTEMAERTCETCGAKNDASARFCWNCDSTSAGTPAARRSAATR